MKPARAAYKTAEAEEAMKSNPVQDARPPISGEVHLGSGARRQSGFPIASGPMSRHGAADAGLWTAYWQEFCLENQPHERCHIPGDGRHVVDRHWAHFAALLPREAHVIDLGCGAGVVGRTLLRHRNDLRVTGIDIATVPTPHVPNLTIHPGVNMEVLPFETGGFDAATSLFGIEYANIDRTARELGRILRPGARCSFLIHHHESEIVCEGGTRRRGLQKLLSGKVKAAFLAGGTAAIEQQIRRLNSQFPGEPSIKLFSNYLRHHIAGNRTERQTKWQDLLDGLTPEIELLVRLERSAKSESEIGNWLASLLPVMKAISIAVVRRSSGEPIAWQVNGNR
jgi:SAM-dependent methyltransferase